MIITTIPHIHSMYSVDHISVYVDNVTIDVLNN